MNPHERVSGALFLAHIDSMCVLSDSQEFLETSIIFVVRGKFAQVIQSTHCITAAMFTKDLSFLHYFYNWCIEFHRLLLLHYFSGLQR